MRIFIRLFAAICILFFSSTLLAQRYFGYFAGSGFTNEHYQHSNITFVWQGHTTKSLATQNIINDLNVARTRGVKAIVMVESFLFNKLNGQLTTNPQSAADWSAFVNALVSAGHLSYNNPAASTVVSFYVVDEPELNGLADSPNAVHPAVSNAVATIKNNPATTSFPNTIIFSKRYNNAARSRALVDWAGMDDYSLDDSAYVASFRSFQSGLRADQRSILIPQASTGGMMQSYGNANDPDAMFNFFNSDQKIVLLMPFLWQHPNTAGVRDLPVLRDSYTAIGSHIKNGGPIPLLVSGYCLGSTFGYHVNCSATGSRGLPPYRYLWQNGSTSPNIQYAGPCGSSTTARVVVTDARGTVRAKTLYVPCVPG